MVIMKTSTIIQFSSIPVVFWSVMGCTASGNGRTSVDRMQSDAVLAAARANHLSMFGELPGDADQGLSAKTAVSLQQHTFTETGADSDSDLDPTGEFLVYASTRNSTSPDLHLKRVNGVSITQLTSDPASDVQPVFSPDGRRIAFASDRGGNWDIWVIGVDGGPPLRVTNTPHEEMHPGWSPDGNGLVYCSRSENGGQWELWITDAVAGGARRFIGYGLFPEWSPVGDRILFQRAREQGGRLFSVWTITLTGGEPGYPTEVASAAQQAMILPTWSPDGRQIALVSAAPVSLGGEEGNHDSHPPSDIWMVREDGSGRVRLTDGHTMNTSPVFSPDGRLFFTSNRSGFENIWSVSLADHPLESVPEKHGIRKMSSESMEETGEQEAGPTIHSPSVQGGL